MDQNREALKIAGQVDISNALRHLDENKTLRKEVFAALYDKYILNKKLKDLSGVTKEFFEKFQFYVDQDPVAEYQLFEKLQVQEEKEEHRDTELQRGEILERADEVRSQISFLEQAGQEPVQWLEEYQAERVEEQRDVMSQILDLNPGDKVIVKAPFGDKLFAVTKHNRTQQVIVAQSEDGEEKRIRYRIPAVLEEFVKDVKKVIVSAKNKPRQPELQEDMKKALASELRAAEQETKRLKKKAA